jgi:hypothetical protein
MGGQLSGRRGRRTVGAAWLGVVLFVGLAAALSPQKLAAQSLSEASSEVQVGDRWVFDSKDEITGYPKETYTHVVTEISPKEIVVSLTVRGKSGSTILVYDHDWNLVEGPVWKYKPSDGQGIRLPLAVGKEWRSEGDVRNVQTGVAHKYSIVSKVAAQETVTTSAGTFETFKIESRLREIAAADPSKVWEVEIVNWYAPQINHWIRRTSVTKFQKRTTVSTSDELVDFSRKL